MLNDWGEVHCQHDVCEFIQHLTQRVHFPMFEGSWRAMAPVMMHGDRPMDMGSCAQPIILHLPMQQGSTIRIQSLIDEWHRSVDRFHGLDVAPPVGMLQLHRFSRRKR